MRPDEPLRRHLEGHAFRVLRTAVLSTLAVLLVAAGAFGQARLAAKHHKAPARRHKTAKHHKAPARRHKTAKHHHQPAKHHTTPRQHWLVLRNPIRPAQELDMPFGKLSWWLQPWRAYLTTPPAANINAGLGINFNVSPSEADVTAAALERAGFHRARIEIGWDSIDPNDVNRLSPYYTGADGEILTALYRHHIRPLILLNANDGAPTPIRAVTLHVVAAAPAGSRVVVLDPASASQVVPGRTGFNSLTSGNVAAAVVITALDGAVATLSTPLPTALSPGNYPGSTLAFAPFSSPGTPSFAATLAGWLDYVHAVGSLVHNIYHGNAFDMEVWNEESFGSNFLNINNYYSPPIDPNTPASGLNGPTNEALVSDTASFIHQDFPGVQVGDGFDDQTPFPAGPTEVPGVNIDKHYYNGQYLYPQDYVANGDEPVDWLGRPFATYSYHGSDMWTPFWTPSFVAYFPEYWLSGLRTETLIRDLTPLRGDRLGPTPHGRYTHPPGAPPPQVWMTEYNLDTIPSPALTPVQAQRFQAKVVLRYLLAYINKGLALVDFYAAQGGEGLLPNSFYATIGKGRRPNPGLTLDALGRMTRYLRIAPRMRPRSVTLLQISTTDKRNVFNGYGPYPPLRNLDVAAFFPFQEATHRFVFAAYVMTSNLLQPWQRPGAHQYDMPAATYRFRIGHVNGCHTTLSAYDPLNNKKVKVTRVHCTAHTLTLQTELTDSPILIQANGA